MYTLHSPCGMEMSWLLLQIISCGLSSLLIRTTTLVACTALSEHVIRSVIVADKASYYTVRPLLASVLSFPLSSPQKAHMNKHYWCFRVWWYSSGYVVLHQHLLVVVEWKDENHPPNQDWSLGYLGYEWALMTHIPHFVLFLVNTVAVRSPVT
jgi:hypothetical protein